MSFPSKRPEGGWISLADQNGIGDHVKSEAHATAYNERVATSQRLPLKGDLEPEPAGQDKFGPARS